MSAFDPRVVPASRAMLVRAVQSRTSCRLGGGAALAGLHLHHRLSRDLDLFFDDAETLRDAVRLLPEIATEAALSLDVVRDARTHVRVAASGSGDAFEIDLVYEPAAPIAPPTTTDDGVRVESYVDLQASKIACLVERSEPRDLVDVLFLERSGLRVEDLLPLAIRKDAGVDPGVLAWLLRDFPTSPLPAMLAPLDEAKLREFRDALAARMRALAVTP